MSNKQKAKGSGNKRVRPGVIVYEGPLGLREMLFTKDVTGVRAFQTEEGEIGVVLTAPEVAAQFGPLSEQQANAILGTLFELLTAPLGQPFEAMNALDMDRLLEMAREANPDSQIVVPTDEEKQEVARTKGGELPAG